MHPYSDLIAALYQQLSVKMFKAAYRRLNDRELAEDMVSKAFAVLLEKLLDPVEAEKFINHPNQEAWLMETLGNLCRNEQTRAHKRYEVAMDEKRPDIPIEQEFLSFEDHLPPDLPELERKILWMKAEGGYDFADIAAATGKTPGNCRVIYHRARKRCQEYLEKMEKTGGNCNDPPDTANITDRRCRDARDS